MAAAPGVGCAGTGARWEWMLSWQRCRGLTNLGVIAVLTGAVSRRWERVWEQPALLSSSALQPSSFCSVLLPSPSIPPSLPTWGHAAHHHDPYPGDVPSSPAASPPAQAALQLPEPVKPKEGAEPACCHLSTEVCP